MAHFTVEKQNFENFISLIIITRMMPICLKYVQKHIWSHKDDKKILTKIIDFLKFHSNKFNWKIARFFVWLYLKSLFFEILTTD